MSLVGDLIQPLPLLLFCILAMSEQLYSVMFSMQGHVASPQEAKEWNLVWGHNLQYYEAKQIFPFYKFLKVGVFCGRAGCLETLDIYDRVGLQRLWGQMAFAQKEEKQDWMREYSFSRTSVDASAHPTDNSGKCFRMS